MSSWLAIVSSLKKSHPPLRNPGYAPVPVGITLLASTTSLAGAGTATIWSDTEAGRKVQVSWGCIPE